MKNATDLNDPYATAADAVGAARRASPELRALPNLLGSRLSPTLGQLADRFERGRVLDEFCCSALDTVLAECDRLIENGTEQKWVSYESGWGPNGPTYNQEFVHVRAPEAEELLRIRQQLQSVKTSADRTRDLIAAEAAVNELRS